jgi:hypothetical protein
VLCETAGVPSRIAKKEKIKLNYMLKVELRKNEYKWGGGMEYKLGRAQAIFCILQRSERTLENCIPAPKISM